MVSQDYLSLLSWQGCKLFPRDFEGLKKEKIQNPEHFVSLVSSPETKDYLLNNKSWWKKAEEDYKYFQKQNYKLLYPGKTSYPDRFLNCFKTVPILLTLGELLDESVFKPITLVGSRNPEDTVLNWLDFYLPSVIKEHKISLVSGGARGVDQKVHGVALRSSCPTVCFLPSGLDCFYPQSLQNLKFRILDSGGVFVSCFPPWAKMYKSYFSVRNALMSAYSSLVLILQAEIRSGTMLTAQKALDYSVPLAVLPGPVLSVKWTGNLQLIHDGAYVVRDHIDLSLLIGSLDHSRDGSP